MVGTWGIAAIATIIGLIPGLIWFHWLASPFPPGVWVGKEVFTRLFLTISQVIREYGVLVKRETGEYEIGTYLPDTQEIVLTDRRLPVDGDSLVWGLFGKRHFGLTWEPGTEFHERIQADTAATDGGGLPIDMGAAHRYLRGVNDSDAITRTENKAKAEHGGGSDGISDMWMAILIGVMLLLGSLTTYIML